MADELLDTIGRQGIVSPARRAVRITGIRGIPARHGGFETFAERLALYLTDRGWQVTVCCQGDAARPRTETFWQGVRLLHYPAGPAGALGTVVFDWRCIRDAASAGELVLTLGYNTALFNALLKRRGVPNLINMDGLEWRRGKWSTAARLWLYANERIGCYVADHLIADHPRIRELLARQTNPGRITMIPYGADAVVEADPKVVLDLGLEPRRYALVVARIEPENSILEVVHAFSRRPRGAALAILGDLQRAAKRYQREIRAAAGDEVRFLGAIYERRVVNALRFHSLLYVHGHSVGGTNPSLVEAMGAGSAVVAHDNEFNRWVVSEGACYFRDEQECAARLDELLDDPSRLARMALASRQRFQAHFTWSKVLGEYESLLNTWTVAGDRS